jgi:hypothetical protein
MLIPIGPWIRALVAVTGAPLVTTLVPPPAMVDTIPPEKDRTILLVLSVANRLPKLSKVKPFGADIPDIRRDVLVAPNINALTRPEPESVK